MVAAGNADSATCVLQAFAEEFRHRIAVVRGTRRVDEAGWEAGGVERQVASDDEQIVWVPRP